MSLQPRLPIAAAGLLSNSGRWVGCRSRHPLRLHAKPLPAPIVAPGWWRSAERKWHQDQPQKPSGQGHKAGQNHHGAAAPRPGAGSRLRSSPTPAETRWPQGWPHALPQLPHAGRPEPGHRADSHQLARSPGGDAYARIASPTAQSTAAPRQASPGDLPSRTPFTFRSHNITAGALSQP